jgi:hypothetical protein
MHLDVENVEAMSLSHNTHLQKSVRNVHEMTQVDDGNITMSIDTANGNHIEITKDHVVLTSEKGKIELERDEKKDEDKTDSKKGEEDKPAKPSSEYTIFVGKYALFNKPKSLKELADYVDGADFETDLLEFCKKHDAKSKPKSKKAKKSEDDLDFTIANDMGYVLKWKTTDGKRKGTLFEVDDWETLTTEILDYEANGEEDDDDDDEDDEEDEDEDDDEEEDKEEDEDDEEDDE